MKRFHTEMKLSDPVSLYITLCADHMPSNKQSSHIDTSTHVGTLPHTDTRLHTFDPRASGMVRSTRGCGAGCYAASIITLILLVIFVCLLAIDLRFDASLVGDDEEEMADDATLMFGADAE